MNTEGHRFITADPTNKQKITDQLTEEDHAEGRIDDRTYNCMYPTVVDFPKFCGLPKIHQTYILLRPIVSSRNIMTCGMAKKLIRKSIHHVESPSTMWRTYKTLLNTHRT